MASAGTAGPGAAPKERVQAPRPTTLGLGSPCTHLHSRGSAHALPLRPEDEGGAAASVVWEPATVPRMSAPAAALLALEDACEVDEAVAPPLPSPSASQA